MGSYDEVRGRICRDLASLSIFFDLREATFSTFSFWGRARMYVIFLVWHVPVRTAFGPNLVGWSKQSPVDSPSFRKIGRAVFAAKIHDASRVYDPSCP